MNIDKQIESEERMKLHIFYKGASEGIKTALRLATDSDCVIDGLILILKRRLKVIEQKIKELENESAKE